jgi:hypothetical protein
MIKELGKPHFTYRMNSQLWDDIYTVMGIKITRIRSRYRQIFFNEIRQYD